MLENGFTPVCKATQVTQLVNADVAANLNAVEEILMVGYPNGLWDQKNQFADRTKRYNGVAGFGRLERKKRISH